MATARLKKTRDGRNYYEIRISRGYGKSQYTTQWYVPEGWSAKSIERGLEKAKHEFENKCKAGEITTRREREEIAEQKRLEDEKIQTLRQYGDKVFMPRLTITCSENTRASFQQSLNNRIYPALGDYKLPEINAPMINAFLLGLQAEGLKHASCVKMYTIINLIFKQAYLEDAIDRNPMDKVQRPKAIKAEGKDNEIKAYTGAELVEIMGYLNNEPMLWRCYIRLLMDTGLRRGEACAIRWKNIDLENGLIRIEQTLCYTKDKGVYLDTPKSGKKRTVCIGEEVIALLKDFRKIVTIRQTGIEATALDGIHDFVFTQGNSYAPMHPQSPTHYFKQFGKRYGVNDFHPHKLRHSFASVAITNGADIASVSECLGHADKAVTLRMYTHADQEAQKRAGDIFRNALKANQVAL